MKKLILFFSFNFIYLQLYAQLINPYIQLEGGFAVNQKNTSMVCAEFGVSYKWLDIALATDYESNSLTNEYIGEINIFKDEGYNPDRTHNKEFGFFTYTSLQLVAKIDFIRLFTSKSRHSFKTGGGYGIIRYQEAWSTSLFSENSDVAYNLTTKSNFGLLGSFKVSYEYKLKPKLVLGSYFGGTYYPAVGLLIRSNL